MNSIKLQEQDSSVSAGKKSISDSQDRQLQ